MNLSAQQQATVRLLGNVGKTAKQIATAVGVKSVGAMLQSLHQQGYIRYHGGKGVKLGRGLWKLTNRGKTLARELGGIVKIFSIEVETDAGRRVVKLAAPIEVDARGDMPAHFRSLTEFLWGVLREVARQAPEVPKAEA